MTTTPGWWAQLSALGGYFAMPPAGPDWQNTSDLLKSDNLRAIVAETRAAMARSAGCDPERIPMRAAAAIAAHTLPVFTPLHEGLRATAALSTHIAWGNVISAANGAVTVLALRDRHLEPAGRDLIRALLRTAPLTGAGEFTAARFRRHSCCLFYQVPGTDCAATAC